ncbi:GNAT family N-acetyltransferase [Actinosynnema sp. NPDC020468]|uniref:GNAT family N-acetyltransferase n=1 Tax=Actinosynnema sp. NPDC020468 TaxID=3154488 RepID=UPI0033ED4E3E
MTAFAAMPARLETPRLVLRRWRESDLAEYRALVAERGKGTPTEEDVLGRIRTQLAATAENGIGLYPVEVDGGFIGYCGLIVGRSTLEEPEIAYELYRRAHNRGYATEAAEAVVRAVAATGRDRLWSTVGAGNAPSLRVLEKLGFHRSHVTEGDVVWLTRTLDVH